MTHESRALPTPDEMAGYNAVLPGAAERFVAVWEAEASHRRELERVEVDVVRREVTAAAADRRLGIVLGFLLSFVGIAGLVYGALHGVAFAGLASIVIALGALVWAVRRITSAQTGPTALPKPDREPPHHS